MIDLLQVVANHYDVSARLLAMMCSDPANAQLSASITPRLTSEPFSPQAEQNEKSVHTSLDLESGVQSDAVSGVEATRNRPGLGGLSFSQIVNEIWHFSSIDYGRRCKALGSRLLSSLGPPHTNV
jgi:hypothetical protein